ncbi:MAG: crotonase/enoyl-CoA hydratase family protein [Archangium sp.]|nr:crotonase/enoyl-CoA hydratase family protein [Archangium sp.]MDP3151961.1 crotonase/enoyl-CoA hydratase family protein [Archangium sp.]MDP3571374.1 crotonase/enoyl-CoA hydratase family protein [Archangium sp.]
MSPLSYTLEGSTAVLRMDDGKANALSDQMITALLESLTRAEKEASAVVLTGRPDRFCAGFDLKVMTAGPEGVKKLFLHGADLLVKLFGFPMPLIIACTGHALAGGAQLLLTADVRFGAVGPYRIGLNETTIGMPLPVLGVEFARARLVPTELSRATLGARIYTPEEAVAAGYLDETAPAAEVLPRAMAEAAELGALSRQAYAATKQRLRGATLAQVTSTLERDMSSLLSMFG